MTESDWIAFARAWVAELGGEDADFLPDLPNLLEDESLTRASDFVVPMNFFGSAEAQWSFIVAVMKYADAEALGYLAAGPVEHILGNHGNEYIGKFEALAKSDERVSKMLNGCYQNRMSEDVWNRVCRLRTGDV